MWVLDICVVNFWQFVGHIIQLELWICNQHLKIEYQNQKWYPISTNITICKIIKIYTNTTICTNNIICTNTTDMLYDTWKFHFSIAKYFENCSNEFFRYYFRSFRKYFYIFLICHQYLRAWIAVAKFYQFSSKSFFCASPVINCISWNDGGFYVESYQNCIFIIKLV